jgi:hypothetical protein
MKIQKKHSIPGRPKAEIKYEELEKLCFMQATDEEIAAWFGVSAKTIQRLKKQEPYGAAFETGAAKGRVSIKRAQFQAAMGGNITMLIWLGKIVLGQKETIANEHSGKDGAPLITVELSPDNIKLIVEKLKNEF